MKPLNNEEPKEQRRKRIKAANDSSGILSYAICTLKGRASSLAASCQPHIPLSTLVGAILITAIFVLQRYKSEVRIKPPY